jgi:hypothetical protein
VLWRKVARHGPRVEERRGDLGHAATSRFLSPLSEPDMRFRIRLSAKTSGLRTREVMDTRSQLHEPQRAVPGGSVSHWVIAPFHGAR